MDAYHYGVSQGCSEETRLFLLGLIIDYLRERFAQEKSRKSASGSVYDKETPLSQPGANVQSRELESERVETAESSVAMSELESSPSSQCLPVQTSENGASDSGLAEKRMNRKRKHHPRTHEHPTSTKKARLDLNNNNNAPDIPVTESIHGNCCTQNEAVTPDLNNNNNNINDTSLDAQVTSRNDPVTYDYNNNYASVTQDCNNKNAPVTEDRTTTNNNNNRTSLDARLEQFFVCPQTNRLIPKQVQLTQNTWESESGSGKAKHSHVKTNHRSEKVKPKQQIQRLRTYRKERSLLKAATIRCLVRKALETGTYCCYKRCFLARPRLYV